MAHQQLNRAQVSPGLEQMRSEGVSQGVRMDVLFDARTLGRLPYSVEYAFGLHGPVTFLSGSLIGEQVCLRFRLNQPPVIAQLLE
jgi:hypothetical protein